MKFKTNDSAIRGKSNYSTFHFYLSIFVGISATESHIIFFRSTFRGQSYFVDDNLYTRDTGYSIHRTLAIFPRNGETFDWILRF